MAIPTRERFDAIKRWPTERSRVWLQEFLAQTGNDPNIVAVIAVGSAVREDVESADLDIIVITKRAPVRSFDAPIEIDVRTYVRDEVSAKVASGHDLLGWAVKFGVPLLDEEGFWSTLTARFADSVPLPSADVAHQRAKQAFRHTSEILEIGDQDAAEEQFLSLVTHLARATLIEHGCYPTSRPELPQQLRAVGERQLAAVLESAIEGRADVSDLLSRFDPVAGSLS